MNDELSQATPEAKVAYHKLVALYGIQFAGLFLRYSLRLGVRGAKVATNELLNMDIWKKDGSLNVKQPGVSGFVKALPGMVR